MLLMLKGFIAGLNKHFQHNLLRRFLAIFPTKEKASLFMMIATLNSLIFLRMLPNFLQIRIEGDAASGVDGYFALPQIITGFSNGNHMLAGFKL